MRQWSQSDVTAIPRANTQGDRSGLRVSFIGRLRIAQLRCKVPRL
ncbi:unnamed protein product, partial [marine sediment metagenome]